MQPETRTYLRHEMQRVLQDVPLPHETFETIVFTLATSPSFGTVRIRHGYITQDPSLVAEQEIAYIQDFWTDEQLLRKCFAAYIGLTTAGKIEPVRSSP